MNKKMIYAGVLALSMGFSQATQAYPVLDIMSGLADESGRLNNALLVDPEFKVLSDKIQSTGATLSLMGVARAEQQGIKVIVHRNDENTYQYQRLKGLTAPFFVLVQNTSGRQITIEPYKINLTVNGRQMNPIPHRRMETLLTRTNMKKATLGDMISKVGTVAAVGVSLAATGGGVSLVKDSVMGFASGQSVEETAFKMLDNPSLKGMKQLAEKEMAEQFRKGDEIFVQPESITLKPYQIVTFNTFFENVSLDQDVELGVYIDGERQHRFHFIDPRTKTQKTTY